MWNNRILKKLTSAEDSARRNPGPSSKPVDTIDKDKTGKLDQARFIASLPDALFPPGFPHVRPEGVKIPESYVAIGHFAARDSDDDGLATKESLKTDLLEATV